jgi:hypothetical protein
MCSPVERRRILEDLAHVRGVHRSVVTLEERLTSLWKPEDPARIVCHRSVAEAYNL